MPLPDWRPGDSVGPYTLVARRGSGGMGVVWEAKDANGATVALKLMHSHLADDEELVQRFRREFEVGRRFSHPNLVGMVDQGVLNGIPFLVMQMVEGKTIRRLIERGGTFREWEAIAMTLQVASGIEALASGGVTHRDLKASNIVVDQHLRTVIIDFGIARIEGERTLTSAESFIGSAEYSSPEPYLGRKVDTRSDVYSMGVVLYEMLTGRVPFRSDRYTDTLRMHAELAVPRVSERVAGTSPEVDDLVYAMLQKQPSQRPRPAEVVARCRELLTLHGRSQIPVAASAASYRPPVRQSQGNSVPRLGQPGTSRNASDRRKIATVLSVGASAVFAVLTLLTIALATQ